MAEIDDIINEIKDLKKRVAALQRLDTPPTAQVTRYTGTPIAGNFASWVGAGTVGDSGLGTTLINSLARYSGTPSANALTYWPAAGTIAAGSIAYSNAGTPLLKATSSAGMGFEDDGGNRAIHILDGGNIGLGGTVATKKVEINGGVTSSDLAFMVSGFATKGYFALLKSGSNAYGQFAVNRDIVGTFSNTAAAAAAINLFSGSANSNFGVYTSPANNTDPTLGLLVDKSQITWLGGLQSGGASILGIVAGTSTNDAAVGGTLYVDSGTHANTTTGETDLASYSVPANTLAVNNQSLEFHAWGTYTNNANAKLLKVYFGSSSWSVLNVGGSAVSWSVRGRIVRTGAATQDVVIEIISTSGGTPVTISTAAETLSGAVTLKLTGTGGATNDIKQEGLVIKWADANT